MIRLHGYWRSTAAWRVRLALAAKGLAYDSVAVNLLDNEQRGQGHLALNLQGLVPVLEHDGVVLTQSLAIIEYLDELFPDPPLLPADPANRARARAAALIVAAEVHPLGNLRVQRWLRSEMGQDDAAVSGWLHHWMADGLAALEAMAQQFGGRCLIGDDISIADLALVPQLYNARRFNLSLTRYPRLLDCEAMVAKQPWAGITRPEVQAGSV
ncbi:maleylacetoacetate isomerase [Sandarakinorhabdus sp.]|uniref:maleylacetoacetate isomerase n=1 Tax=Sandarakinorhabdus sp. TaxID=1916663 RepID=UPI003F72EA92